MAQAPEVDKEIQNGPLRNRSITDCFCCLTMLVFWAATVAVTIFALSKGNPWRLAQTYDKDNVACGDLLSGTSEYPLAYFFQPLLNFTDVVCVSACPSWQNETGRSTDIDCFGRGTNVTENIGNCSSAKNFSFNMLPEQYLQFSQEPFLIYNTSEVFGRFCVPYVANFTDSAKLWITNMTDATKTTEIFEEYLADLKNCWKYLLAIAGLAIGLSIFSLMLIRCCAGVMVWMILLLFLGGVFGMAVLCGIESKRLNEISIMQNTQADSSDTYYNSKNLHYLSIFFYVLGGLCTLIIMGSLSKISISIALLKTAAMFVYSNLAILLIPIIVAIVLAAYLILWIVVFLYLWTIGTSTKRENSPFAQIAWDTRTRYIVIFHAFAFLWNVAFINYFGIFVIACTCSIWYFNSGAQSPHYFQSPILTSIWWGFRYHMGSLALGAFLLSIFWGIRLALLYVYKYVTNLQKKGIESSFVTMILKCLMCCVACFQRFIEFISTLGFVQVAVTGKNFCRSCVDAFGLLASNPMKFGLVHMVGSVFVFIGKIFVASACGVLGYLMITYNTTISAKLYSKIVPVFFFIVIGYFIATIFYSVYGVSADTVVMCFFLDKEISEKGGRPITAPEPMREFYNRYKKE